MKLFNKKDSFLYLTILVFIFISSSALAIGGYVPAIKLPNRLIVNETKTFPPLPVVKANSTFPFVSAQGAMAVDLSSGVSLYEKNPDNAFLPASTTKIVTALVALDTYSLDQIVKVGKVRVEGQKMGLFTGEEMKVEDLLYGLLVFSANDAAEALAENYPGGR